MGLLDLPEDVLDLILSSLGTLSLATVRLACKALRRIATSRRKRVVIVLDGCCEARARASPRVLQAMHTFDVLLERLDEEQQRVGADSSATPDREAYQHFRRFLQQEFVRSVGPGVESLKLETGGFDLGSNIGELQGTPHVDISHVLWSQMQSLERLQLVGRFDRAVLQHLPAPGHLTCLELENVCSNEDMQDVCSMVNLVRLGVIIAGNNGNAFDLQQMLAALAAGPMAGLQELVLPVPAAEAQRLSVLTPLTALTALELDMWDTRGDLGGLASLTGLKSLEMRKITYEAVVESLSPLAALTGLTRLDLKEYDNFSQCDHGLWSDASVLASLPALRVLRCCLLYWESNNPQEAVVRAGHLEPAVQSPRRVQGSGGSASGSGDLPVQFRFLRTATALEELDLTIMGTDSVWSLPHSSSLAVQEAIQEAMRALMSLKKVEVAFVGRACVLEQYHAPLRVFAASPLIESFTFWDLYGACIPDGPSSVCSSAQLAHGCFGALTKLASLSCAAHKSMGRTTMLGTSVIAPTFLRGLPPLT